METKTEFTPSLQEGKRGQVQELAVGLQILLHDLPPMLTHVATGRGGGRQAAPHAHRQRQEGKITGIPT